MRSRIRTCLLASTLLAVPINLGQHAVHAQHQARYPYVLVDVGTFGGPSSYLDEPGITLSDWGAFVGSADSTQHDPNPTQCWNPDCLVSPGFKWQNGSRITLGPLPGGASSAPFSVNRYGTAAGISENGVVDPLTGIPEIRAVTWQGGTIHDLGTLGGNQSFTEMLNTAGQVTGWALNTIPDSFVDFMGSGGTGKTQMRAVLWQGGQARDLGTLGGGDAAATFMNDRGQITGQSFTDAIPHAATGGSPTMDPFFWDNRRMTDIGTLGGTYGFPNAINGRGQVIGQSNIAGDVVYHAFLWSQGSLRDLGTLGGKYAAANNLNDVGQVVGWAAPSGNTTVHPVVWQNGSIRDLGLPPGYDYGFGNSVNALGQIVGNAGIFTAPGQPDQPQHALIWEHGTVRDLNTLIAPSQLTVNWAVSINILGEIAATAVLSDGSQRAVLLIPASLAGIRGFAQYSAAPTPNAARSAVLPTSSGLACPSLSSWLSLHHHAPAPSQPADARYPTCFGT